MSTCPVSETRLSQIAADACDNAFSSATSYNHAQTEQWNSDIIKGILTALISESKGEVQYKFAVNSTIIQHLTDPRPAGSDASPTPTTGTGTVGRRGMHSATGAYWNTEKDGIWNYKYEGGEAKGMDVVVCVIYTNIDTLSQPSAVHGIKGHEHTNRNVSLPRGSYYGT